MSESKLSFWKSLLNQLAMAKGRSSRIPRAKRRLSCESLEDRKLMATFHVSNFEDVVAMDGKLSLREAINSANLTAEPDTIVVPAGVFRIGKLGVNESNNKFGDFDIKNPLKIVGQGAGKTIIDGARQDRVFELIGTYNATFQKMTIRNGGGAIDDLFVKNTIIADNYAGYDSTLDGGNDVAGLFASQGNNLIGVAPNSSLVVTGFVNGVKGDQVGAVDNPIDPMLAPLANNGGPTMTHALLQGSRAIDRGSNGNAPSKDQRGLPRIKDGDRNGVSVIDIGAFEL
jgi:hypothetical protein